MKLSNIKYSVFVYDGRYIVASRHFVSEDAKNRYCNRMHKKYGDNVTVEVYLFQEMAETLEALEANPPKPYEIWKA